MGRPWRRTTIGDRCRPRSSWTMAAGVWFGAVRRSMRCWRLKVRYMLIAFEGLDQSGKQTQAELLRDWLKQEGHKARLVSFPDYGTSIGEEIARALQGEREYDADVMQLLYIAKRDELKQKIRRWLDDGVVMIYC